MHILIIDHSVLAYKAFLRLFSQDYKGETTDELWEWTSQYIREVEYLMALHQPDGILWVLDCPREEIWRHAIARRYYGEQAKIWAVEWMPAMEEPKTADNACRWFVECDNSFKTVWRDADGDFRSKSMTKTAYHDWAKEQADNGIKPPQITNIKMIRAMLPVIAKMYKGTREGSHFPQSAVMDKKTFKVRSRKLAYQVAPLYGGRVAEADKLEADDLAYAAVERWHQHDITVATIDQDWLQLGMHMSRFRSIMGDDGTPTWATRPCGTFKFWDTHTYAFRDTDNEVVRNQFFDKIIRGDTSDNIASCRLKGKIVGIGDKAADKIFDEVPKYELLSWAKKNLDSGTLMRNLALINLARIPEDLKAKANEAILASANTPKSTVTLDDLSSETTRHMAKVDGQKERLAQQQKEKSDA
jgi:5'-3' exonuclease